MITLFALRMSWQKNRHGNNKKTEFIKKQASECFGFRWMARGATFR